MALKPKTRLLLSHFRRRRRSPGLGSSPPVGRLPAYKGWGRGIVAGAMKERRRFGKKSYRREVLRRAIREVRP